MKKKKVLFPILFVIISLAFFTSFTEEAEANGRCEKTVTYYFLLGINMTNQEGGDLVQSDVTTFEKPNFGENLTIKGEPVISTNWTESDAKNYFSNQKASNCTTSNKNAWCDPSDTECLNSGNGGGYLWEDCSTIEVDSSGNFVSVDGYTAEEFMDFTVGANKADVTFTTNSENPNLYDVNVSREWTQEATQEDGNYHNGKWMHQPLKVDVTYEYDCAEEAPKCNVGVVSGSSNDSFSGCGSHGYSVEYNKSVTIPEFESSTTRNDAVCGGYAKINAASIITYKESGNLASSVNPKQQYAGGGFAFGLNYSGSASWNYCEPNEQNQVICSCTKKVEETVEDCEYKRDEDGKLVYDENGDLVKECTTKKQCSNRLASCRCSDADIATAKDKIAAEAEKEFTGASANPSVKSQDSNKVDFSVNKQEIGSISAGGGNKSSTISFKPNTSCIELKGKTVDGTYYPAYVSYGSPCNTNQLDGKRLYYIPLKYPDGGQFHVNASSGGDIGVLAGNNWTFNVACSVNVKQVMYKTPNGTPKGYKFIYRPIDMSNPFPKTVNQNREIGSNWIDFMNDEQAKTKKLNRNDNGLEYYATLDKDTIRNIRKENDSKSYAGLDTINTEGESSLLDNGYLNMVEKTNNAKINKLGECTEDCW